MRLIIAAPGRLHHPGAQAFAEDYSRRIERIMPLHRQTIREARRRKGGRDPRAQDKESAALLRTIPQGATLVAMDAGGKAMNSEAFLLWLVGLAETGTRHLAFVIGGPDGLSREVLEASDRKLSLSPMVLPHELAEVLLLEQIYRALCRWKGLPYHR
jgi:23S rRNA (pseudouridine1915-N3)-methyltransferase